jgi:hypothetical protein
VAGPFSEFHIIGFQIKHRKSVAFKPCVRPPQQAPALGELLSLF